MKLKVTAIGLVMVCIAVLFAACGTDDGNKMSEVDTTASTTARATTTAADGNADGEGGLIGGSTTLTAGESGSASM